MSREHTPEICGLRELDEYCEDSTERAHDGGGGWWEEDRDEAEGEVGRADHFDSMMWREGS